MKTKSIIILLAVSLILGGITGFFMGRGKQVYKEVHTIEYREATPIKIEVPTPYPVTEKETTTNVHYIAGETKYVHDTLDFDTTAVFKDYMKERTYHVKMFDNKEQGKLYVDTKVQYNKQMNVGIDYKPVVQTETITKTIKQTFTPYVGASFNSLNYIGFSAGMYYHNIGAEYQYHTNRNNSAYHEVGVRVKF